MEFDADVIVLGGGAAGTFAALGLEGTDTLLLDYGNLPEADRPSARDLADLKLRQDAFQWLIGGNFESLDPLFGREMTPKIKSPLMRYVVRDAEKLNRNHDGDFNLVTSLAMGGLCNAWGAQVYRFDDRDLREFPITRAQLDPWYDSVAREIGISGSAEDDLASCHGNEPDLQPPLNSTRLGGALYRGYLRNRAAFARRGIRMGKPRLAVLTREFGRRQPLRYDNLEFFIPGNTAYYSPIFTLKALEARRAIRYLGGMLATGFRESAEGVEVDVSERDSGAIRIFRARKVVVALGCVQSAAFVLKSAGDYTSALPILENPMTFTPLVHPGYIGAAYERQGYSSEWNLYCRENEDAEFKIGMIYNLGGLLASDLVFSFPLPARVARSAGRAILPAMLALQLYYPMSAAAGNHLRLKPDGGLSFSFQHRYDGRLERNVLAAVARTGFFSHLAISKRAKPGTSIHYAGSLPMKAEARSRYQTDPSGRLEGYRHAYVADSANFPYLPAKNLTYTIMANALRIGHRLKETILSEKV